MGEFDLTFELGGLACARHVPHAAFNLQDFLNALVTDHRLGHGVGHLREIAHRLVHLPQIQQEYDQHTGGELAGQRQPCPVPQDQTRPDGHDDLHDRRKLGFDASGLEPGLHVFQTFRFESFLFVLFPGKCLDHADGGQHFLHDGEQFAFLFSNRARGLLDAPRVGIDHQKEHGRDREGNEGKAPVEIKHDPDHADQRHHVDQNAEQRGVDEVLDGFDVAGDPRDQVAGPRLIVFGQRQPLNVVVQGPAQVVPHPLADARRQVFLEVGADGADNRNDRDRGYGEVQNCIVVLAEQPR